VPIPGYGARAWRRAGDVNQGNPKSADYGATFARVYDEWYRDSLDTDAAVEYFASLAEVNTALELGVGTGRIALPLAERGKLVTGLDSSPEMIALLARKCATASLAVEAVQGDFANFDLGRSFDLVYLPFASLFLLRSQADQITCLRSVARHLTDRGVFVLDAFVPDLSRYVDDGTVGVEEAGGDRVRLEVAKHDAVTQSIQATRVVIDASGAQLFPLHLRYAWPTELDAMCLCAGLRLLERTADYTRAAFTGRSTRHVSTYVLDGMSRNHVHG
jgi:SAM-dependent methyltransferase